jgi:YidC/Oxa1 family membrane protein insertase
MEKRLLLAAALSIGILVLWEVIVPKPAPPPATAPAPSAAAPAPTPEAPSAPAPKGENPPPPVLSATPGIIPEVHAEREESITIEEPLYRATFSNRGAVLTSFILKKFDDDQGHPLEMVHQIPSVPPAFLGLEFGADAAATKLAASGLYETTRGHDASGDHLRFRLATEGRSIEKDLTFSGGYVFSVRVAVAGTVEPFSLLIGPGLRNLSETERQNRFTNASGAVYFDGERARAVPRQKIETPQTGALPKAGFAGLEDNYFLAALVSELPAQWKFEPARFGKTDDQVFAGLAGQTELVAKLFIGPKDLDVLAAPGLHLEETVSFRSLGVNLGPIAKAMIWMLKAAHRYLVPNWGVAILAVTLVLRLVLFPLMQKSFVGMKKMQKLQPRINVIREKYKKAKLDAEQRNKMNQEMMALYQAEGYNPMSGCLPLLLQMPIFLAFYVILQKAIELRHAPFYFWIHDLSAKDPTYVLLILMVASMFIQQMMTPSTVDATQRKVFLMMPLMWGFFLKDMPAGLVLYWLFSNVLTILQQMIINRMYRDEPAPAPVRGKIKKSGTRG